MHIDDIRVNDNALLCSTDIIYLNYLLIRYSFDTYTSKIFVQNEGILGSCCNVALVNGCTMITMDSENRSKYLSSQAISDELYILLTHHFNSDELHIVDPSFQFGVGQSCIGIKDPQQF